MTISSHSLLIFPVSQYTSHTLLVFAVTQQKLAGGGGMRKCREEGSSNFNIKLIDESRFGLFGMKILNFRSYWMKNY